MARVLLPRKVLETRIHAGVSAGRVVIQDVAGKLAPAKLCHESPDRQPAGLVVGHVESLNAVVYQAARAALAEVQARGQAGRARKGGAVPGLLICLDIAREEGMPFANGDGGEGDAVCDIADGVDRVDG